PEVRLLTVCSTTDNSSFQSPRWTVEVENLLAFQVAGTGIDKSPETGSVKKLQHRNNTFYYYSRKRECWGCDAAEVKADAH
uniref:Uncharacterized protein n=1 Tax=Monopterus albus TaxID=43700 RepID=A0A3Q3IV68_MONAL